MGEVYEAEHLHTGRPVAIKILSERASGDVVALERFQREARLAGGLVHDHICEVTDFGQDEEGAFFLVMPLLKGRTLKSLIRAEAPLAPDRALAITLQILDGLSGAHRQRVLHRDLKPDNIFLTSLAGQRDFVKILDFGISKRLGTGDAGDALPTLTSPGNLVGTPQYMSPEQIRGKRALDERADVYSVGVILYEMLAGARPFEAETLPDLVHEICYSPLTPLSRYRKDVPGRLEGALLKALARSRDERLASAVAFRRALLGVVADELGSGEVAPTPTPTPMPTSESTVSQEILSSTEVVSPANDLEGNSVSRPRPRTALWVLPAVFVAASALGLAVFWSSIGERAQGSDEAPGAHASEPAPESPAVPRSPPLVESSVEPTPAPEERAISHITLEGAPSRASVFVDDEPVAVEPLAIERGGRSLSGVRFELEGGGDAVRLRLEAPGYRPWRRSIVPGDDQSLVVSMEREPRRSVKRSPSPRSGAKSQGGAPLEPARPTKGRLPIDLVTTYGEGR